MKKERGKFISGAFISNSDLKRIKEKLDDFEVVISTSDLGCRGNFKLINKVSDKVYEFKNSKLQETQR